MHWYLSLLSWTIYAFNFQNYCFVVSHCCSCVVPWLILILFHILCHLGIQIGMSLMYLADLLCALLFTVIFFVLLLCILKFISSFAFQSTRAVANSVLPLLLLNSKWANLVVGNCSAIKSFSPEKGKFSVSTAFLRFRFHFMQIKLPASLARPSDPIYKSFLSRFWKILISNIVFLLYKMIQYSRTPIPLNMINFQKSEGNQTKKYGWMPNSQRIKAIKPNEWTKILKKKMCN